MLTKITDVQLIAEQISKELFTEYNREIDYSFFEQEITCKTTLDNISRTTTNFIVNMENLRMKETGDGHIDCLLTGNDGETEVEIPVRVSCQDGSMTKYQIDSVAKFLSMQLMYWT